MPPQSALVLAPLGHPLGEQDPEALRVVEHLEVEKGWETAVETVLGFWLDAVLLDDPAALPGGLQRLGGEGGADLDLTLLGNTSGAVRPVAGSLAEKVTAPDAVIALLNRVGRADSLEQASTALNGEARDASLITAEGHWIGCGWIRVAGSQSGRAGMLARKQEIKSLRDEIGKLRQRWSALDASNGAERAALAELE